MLAAPAAAQQSSQQAPQWWERITFGGDFRGRYEGFFQDERATRNRERFRLRLSVRAEITDDLTLGTRLVSGGADDIASSNQSLGGFLARKPVDFDQAFLTYNPGAFKPLTLGFGKYPYPVRRTQMVWDDDVNWEGTYEQIGTTVAGGALRLVAVQSPINEVSGGDDAFMLGWYGEAGWTVRGNALAVALANYQFLREDQIAVGVDRLGLNNANTNLLTRDAAGAVTGFLSEFNLIDLIGTATIPTGAADYPINFVADAVWNTDAATDQDAGVWLSAGVGRASTPGTVSLTYTFARIEQDAVVRTFSFSDVPGTNVRMNMLNLSFMPAPRVNLDLITIFTRPLVGVTGPAANLLTRMQVDARVTF